MCCSNLSGPRLEAGDATETSLAVILLDDPEFEVALGKLPLVPAQRELWELLAEEGDEPALVALAEGLECSQLVREHWLRVERS